MAESVGFGFSHTYCANPISCATGVAVLDEYERQSVIANTLEQGAHLRPGLEAVKQTSPVIGDVRGMGLCMAVELVADKATKAPFPLSFAPTDYIRIAGLEAASSSMRGARPKAGTATGSSLLRPEHHARGVRRVPAPRYAATLDDFERDLRARGLIA